MSTWTETAEELHKRTRLRRYAPHPLAPTEEELEQDPRERSFEEVMEDQTGKPAFGPL